VSELARFIETRAIHLPHDLSQADPALLAPLVERVGDSDVVALGELNHFVHEKTDFRLLLTRFLLAQGWRDIFEEIGWSDGHRIDRYLQNGDETALRLPSFDDLSHLRSDRNDRPGGILKVDDYPVAEFVAEQKRFYRGLRATGLPVRHAGIDIDAIPGGAYDDIAASLPAQDPRTAPFLQALQRVPGESPRDESARLRAIAIPADWPPHIAAAHDALAGSLDYIAMTYTAQTYEAVRPGMAFREGEMKRRYTTAERLLGSQRQIVLGHALHLAKNDDLIASAGVGPGGNKVPSLGHWLAQERRRKVFAIWMLYGAGEDCQPLASLPRKAKFPRSTLNAQLARLTDTPLLFFPADALELFARPVGIGHMYNAVFETPLAAQADAVLFLPRVTPLRA
jgi:erythromycin esterase-like protein